MYISMYMVKGKYLCMNASYCRMYSAEPYDGSVVYLYEYINQYIYIYMRMTRLSLVHTGLHISDEHTAVFLNHFRNTF